MPLDLSLLNKARQIGADVAGPSADSVDLDARFPKETFDALKNEKLLSALIPTELGGFGCTIETLSACCQALSQHCASSGMIFAMHQIQVACILRHGETPFLKSYLTALVSEQRLIGSVTSEVGTSGNLRASIAAVVRQGGVVSLKKNATTVSYGAESDDLLVTVRRNPDAEAGDQVLILLQRSKYLLEKTGIWDTLGMRGTVSAPFLLSAEFQEEQILSSPFGEIAVQTMVPFAHLLWSSCWLGIATGAISRAGAYVRAAARKQPGITPPSAIVLAEASQRLQTMQSDLRCAINEYETILASGNTDLLSGFGFSILINNLKVTISQTAVQVVDQAMLICGIEGYKNNSQYSVGRYLRDAHSALLMINNHRILATNASMLLIHKKDAS